MTDKTSEGLLAWFKRNNLKPTGNSEKDMQTFKKHTGLPKFSREVK